MFVRHKVLIGIQVSISYTSFPTILTHHRNFPPLLHGIGFRISRTKARPRSRNPSKRWGNQANVSPIVIISRYDQVGEHWWVRICTLRRHGSEHTNTILRIKEYVLLQVAWSEMVNGIYLLGTLGSGLWFLGWYWEFWMMFLGNEYLGIGLADMCVSVKIYSSINSICLASYKLLLFSFILR